MTGITAQFERGTSLLDITAAPYHIGIDFDLPVVVRRSQLAGGSSVNRYGGQRAVLWRGQNVTINFSILVEGKSEAEVRLAIRALDDFISHTTEVPRLMFAVGGDSYLGFEPLWGQFGGLSRYQVSDARVGPVPMFTIPDLRSFKLMVPVSLQISPYAQGLVQQVAVAGGGVLQDTIGRPDGGSAGLIIEEATTNLLTNPIFGNKTTWDLGWTSGSDISAFQNRDRRFITHGKSSAKVVNIGAAADLWTESINVGDTLKYKMTAYVKLPDGGVVSPTQVGLWYGGPLAEDYTLIGDGWYKITGPIAAGVAAATDTGIRVKAGFTVYLGAIQLEQKDDYETPICHGDMLGCGWNGTVHASTSFRNAAAVTVQDNLDLRHALDVAEGTLRIVWKAPRDIGDYPVLPVNRFFWLSDQTTIHGFISKSGGDAFVLSDGLNDAISAAQTFVEGDILILHFIWGPGRMKIYRDGAEIATVSAYQAVDDASPSIGIGSAGSLSHLGGTFMGFETFGVAMTAARVLLDYENVRRHVEDGRRLSSIPWAMFTTVNNGGANYMVSDGIPGSVPAITEAKIEPLTIWSGAENVWMSKAALDRWIHPDDSIFHDFSGTAEASAWGDAVKEITVTTSEIAAVPTSAILGFEYLASKDFYVLARLADAGSGLSAKIRVQRGNTKYESEFRSLAADVTYRLFVLGPTPMWSYEELVMEFTDFRIDDEVTVDVIFKRTSGSAIVSLDFYAVLPRPLTQIVTPLSITQGPRIKANQVSTRLNTDDSIITIDRIIGDILELEPEKVNVINTYMGKDGLEQQVDDEQLLYKSILVTPRWSLL